MRRNHTASIQLYLPTEVKVVSLSGLLFTLAIHERVFADGETLTHADDPLTRESLIHAEHVLVNAGATVVDDELPAVASQNRERDILPVIAHVEAPIQDGEFHSDQLLLVLVVEYRKTGAEVGDVNRNDRLFGSDVRDVGPRIDRAQFLIGELARLDLVDFAGHVLDSYQLKTVSNAGPASVGPALLTIGGYSP